MVSRLVFTVRISQRRAKEQRSACEGGRINLDHLAYCSPKEVADFYRRLSFKIQDRSSHGSLAAGFLLHWLDGRGTKKIFDSSYVKDSPTVNRYLLEEVRPVFLSQKKARLLPRALWGGIVARLKGVTPPGAAGQLSDGSYPMMYEGQVVTIPFASIIKGWLGITQDEREVDIYYALHSFSLVTEVLVRVEPVTAEQYAVTFDRWHTKATDRYHWNPQKFIRVPNPDFGSSTVNAIAPHKRFMTVHYKHALRVEAAGLAYPFDNESTEWIPENPEITAPAIVDTSHYSVTHGVLEYRPK